MRYPKILSEHGTIGFVAPSFGCATEPYHTAFLNAQKKFKNMGHPLDLGPNCYADCGIGISNTPEACGRELTEYYCSDKNEVLISCGGGELMCETLDAVDFEQIRAAVPKWYMGYSDNTNMTYLLATLCDTASVYGPCAAAFGMEPWHPSLSDAYALLRGQKHTVNGYDLWEKESLKDAEHPLVPYHVTEQRILHVFPEPTEALTVQGRLIGGCMDCLVNLLGTTYDKTTGFVEKYKNDDPAGGLADEACRLVFPCESFSDRKTCRLRAGTDGAGSVPCGVGSVERLRGAGHYGCGYRTPRTDDAAGVRKLCNGAGERK